MVPSLTHVAALREAIQRARLVKHGFEQTMCNPLIIFFFFFFLFISLKARDTLYGSRHDRLGQLEGPAGWMHAHTGKVPYADT